MPPITRIQKEDILNAAYEIARKEGLDGINARAIAKNLNCSVQPIFHKFSNMEELKKELIEKILVTYRNYMFKKEETNTPYKQMGKNYIKFAKEEANLFQIIFMTPTELTFERFMMSDQSYHDIEKCVRKSTQLSDENSRKFHMKMWIFTHGIATLVANKTCEFTEEQIENLLIDEYKALMKLEESRGV